MKAKKALRRLTKIESLLSALTERYSASAPHLRAVLKEAADAVARAKRAVSLQASKTATAKPGRATTTAQKKAPVKKVAAKSRRAKPAAKKTAVGQTAKKKVIRRMVAAPVVQTAMEAVGK